LASAAFFFCSATFAALSVLTFSFFPFALSFSQAPHFHRDMKKSEKKNLGNYCLLQKNIILAVDFVLLEKPKTHAYRIFTTPYVFFPSIFTCNQYPFLKFKKTVEVYEITLH